MGVIPQMGRAFLSSCGQVKHAALLAVHADIGQMRARVGSITIWLVAQNVARGMRAATFEHWARKIPTFLFEI